MGRKEVVLKKALEGQGLSEDTFNFILTLAQKGRVNLLPEIIGAFEGKNDEARGVIRGEVRSPQDLSQGERQEIEKVVSEALGKEVIFTYKVDSSLIGGLIAQVGSYTFDDTLTSHLRRLGDDLNRR